MNPGIITAIAHLKVITKKYLILPKSLIDLKNLTEGYCPTILI